jgi:hypothetical protein
MMTNQPKLSVWYHIRVIYAGSTPKMEELLLYCVDSALGLAPQSLLNSGGVFVVWEIYIDHERKMGSPNGKETNKHDNIMSFCFLIKWRNGLEIILIFLSDQ